MKNKLLINKNFLKICLIFMSISLFAVGLNECQALYITQLEFADAMTKMRMPSQESALIDKAVVTGITRAVQTNPQLKYNDANHTIENTPANVQKLIDIIFDPLLTPEKRMGQIISDIMSPAKVDVIVTGQYVDNQQTLQVRPFMIVKASQKIVFKVLNFEKDEYFCPDPVDRNRKALCQNAHESIAQAVNILLVSEESSTELIVRLR